MKAILLLVAVFFATAAAAAETRPVVVELFTSQGCSSCPPADRLLGDLAKRGDVIALGFHITYWDGAAWRWIPLSRPASTERQLAYDKRLTGGQAYTPQIIVDGTEDAVGSDRAAVLAAIGAAKPVAVAPVSFSADRRSVTVGIGTAAQNGTVLLARYALMRTTQVAGGENANRTATDFNGVEQLQVLGGWDGEAISFAIEPLAKAARASQFLIKPRMAGSGAAAATGMFNRKIATYASRWRRSGWFQGAAAKKLCRAIYSAAPGVAPCPSWREGLRESVRW